MLRSILTGVLLLAAAFAHAAVPPGISGSWYDAAHAGHGLSIQVLDDGRAIAYWFTYDAAGAPLHVYVDGVIDGRVLRGPAYAATGMRFGPFDPAELRVPQLGTIAIAFESCGRAVLDYAFQNVASGSIPLQRLSQLATLGCDDRELAPLPVGLYTGDFVVNTGPSFPIRGVLRAAVDPDGRLWAISAFRPPGPMWVGAYIPPVIASSRRPRFEAGTTLVDADLLAARGLSNGHTVHVAPRPFPIRFDAEGRGRGHVDAYALAPLTDANLAFDAAGTAARLRGRLTLAELAGVYAAPTQGQLVHLDAHIAISADGSACVRFPGRDAEGTCAFSGRVRIRSSTHRFFDFELTESSTGIRHAGRGWAETGDAAGSSITRVTLVGSGDDDGFGLSAVRP